MNATSSPDLADDAQQTSVNSVEQYSGNLQRGTMLAMKPKTCKERWRSAPCDGCAPGLYKDQIVKELLQDQCAMVLVASQRTDWHAEWQPSELRRKKLEKDLFVKMDAQGKKDGVITWEEFNKFCEESKNEFKNLPKRMQGLLNTGVRERAFKLFDVNESTRGETGLDKDEFDKFMLFLENRYMEYLLRCAHLAYRAFWGRGLELEDQTSVSGPLATPRDDMGDVLEHAAGVVNARAWRAFRMRQSRSLTYAAVEEQGHSAIDLDDIDDDTEVGRCWVRCGNWFFGVDKDIPPGRCTILPPGWGADLWYYSANNHPLHGIFMCDAVHPLDWKERVWMELSTFGVTVYSVFMTDELGKWADERHDVIGIGDEFKFATRQAYSLLYVTLPGVAFWYALYFLYTCPCGNIEEAEATEEEIQKAKRLRQEGKAFAHFVMFLSLVGVLYMYGWSRLVGNIWGDHHKRDAGEAEETWLLGLAFLGRLKGYIISWCLMLFIYFNPLVAWGNPNASAELTCCEKIADLVAIGQWRIEKLRFQSLCRSALQQANAAVEEAAQVRADAP